MRASGERAIVFAGHGRVEIRTIRVPPLRPREVRVRTEVTGVSPGTDRWMLEGRYRGVEARYPFVYGYLRVGVVEEVGGDVPTLRPGDRVFLGLSGTRLDPADGLGEEGGAYTSVAVADWTDAYRLPPDVSAEEAALAGLAAVSRRGVRLTGVREGDLVVVVGQGMIGQMAAQLCRARGSRVIAADILEERVALAGRWSADVAVNTAVHSLPDVVRRERLAWGDPRGYGPRGPSPSVYETRRWREVDGGADVVIDAVGNSALVAQWIGLLRREGRLCLQGYFPDPLVLDYHPLHLRRATVVFPGGFDLDDYGAAVSLLREGRLHIAPLITHRLPATQAAEAFRLLLAEPGRVLGMVLDWRQGE